MPKPTLKQNEKCYGCYACCNICPKDAISMIENKKGFSYPVIDEQKCIECGLCERVCFQEIENIKTSEELPVYIGRIDDDNQLQISQSGGAFKVLSDIILSKKGYIVGCVLDSQFKAKHILSCDISDIEKMRGSKYIHSRMEFVFRDIEKKLKENLYVLFSGTPCQCYAVKQYVKTKKINDSKLFITDIICHGVCSPKIWRQILDKYEKDNNGKVVYTNFRNKVFGWRSPFALITIKDNNEQEISINDKLFRTMFSSVLILRDSCYHCKYAQRERYSDITIGDAWGISKEHKWSKDNKGTSIIITNTYKGKMLVDEIQISNKMVLEKVNIKDYMQGNLKQPSKPNRDVNEFWRDYDKKSFSFILEKYGKNRIYLNKKYICKKILKKIFISKK